MNHSAGNLNLDRLRRIQATLNRRGYLRDKQNIRCVGFAPVRLDRTDLSGISLPAVTAQFDVRRKHIQVPDTKRVNRLEPVRLLDRSTQRYEQLTLVTKVEQTGEVVPTGVRIEAGSEFATTSAVVRWTKAVPIPEIPTEQAPDDPRWRWGVLSVAHLLAQGLSAKSGKHRTKIERPATCGVGPNSIHGHVIARGRVPGGPDISLIETGLDRLWLSGLLIRPNDPTIRPADENQLLTWVMHGTDGVLLGDGQTHPVSWRTYYPELSIDRLGKLEQVVRYEVVGQEEVPIPLGPGSSGGVLVAGGIPIGLHVAAIGPHYRIGFAQTFQLSLTWLGARLQASALQLVRLLVDG